LPPNLPRSALTSNFNGSRVLHILESFNLNGGLEAKPSAARGKGVWGGAALGDFGAFTLKIIHF